METRALGVGSFTLGQIQPEAYHLFVFRSGKWWWWSRSLHLLRQQLEHVLQLLHIDGRGVGGVGGASIQHLLGLGQDDFSFLLGLSSCGGRWFCRADLGPPGFSLDEHRLLELGQRLFGQHVVLHGLFQLELGEADDASSIGGVLLGLLGLPLAHSLGLCRFGL